MFEDLDHECTGNSNCKMSENHNTSPVISEHIGNVILRELYLIRKEIKKEVSGLGFKLSTLLGVKENDAACYFKDEEELAEQINCQFDVLTPINHIVGTINIEETNEEGFSESCTVEDESPQSHLTETNLMLGPHESAFEQQRDKELDIHGVDAIEKPSQSTFNDFGTGTYNENLDVSIAQSSLCISSVVGALDVNFSSFSSPSVIKCEEIRELTLDEDNKEVFSENAQTHSLSHLETDFQHSVSYDNFTNDISSDPSTSAQTISMNLRNCKVNLSKQPAIADIIANAKASETCSGSKPKLSPIRARFQKKKKLLCNVCGKSFAQVNHLNLHKRSHAKSKPVICKVCKRPFRSVGSFKRHMHVHDVVDKESSDDDDSDDGVECNICNKVIFTKENVNLHMRSHFKQKNFTCKFCSKMFYNLKAFHIHMKQHDKKILTCNKCERSFSNRKDYAAHLSTHIRAPYACDICRKAFTNLKTLSLHMHSYHYSELYECPLCKRIFSNEKMLKIHKKKNMCNRTTVLS